jgi:hypothetical protein
LEQLLSTLLKLPFGKTDKILAAQEPLSGFLLLISTVQSAIVSVVGDDFPQEYLDLLTARNIDISGLEIVKGGKTFSGAENTITI